MAHPDRIFLAHFPEALEQRRGFEDLDIGAAELAVMAALDMAADLLAERLLAVADGKDRDARIKYRLGARAASLRGVTESGPPEKITPLGCIRSKPSSASWNGTISQ